jgi:hypothetical protein
MIGVHVKKTVFFIMIQLAQLKVGEKSNLVPSLSYNFRVRLRLRFRRQ